MRCFENCWRNNIFHIKFLSHFKNYFANWSVSFANRALTSYAKVIMYITFQKLNQFISNSVILKHSILNKLEVIDVVFNYCKCLIL